MHARSCTLCTTFVATLSLALVGCVEEREYGYKPFFTGLDGAESSTPASADVRAMQDKGEGFAEPRIINEDGSTTLVNSTGRHLMINIVYCLEEDDAELFVQQILSDRAIDDAYNHGREPEDVFEILKENASDVRELFMRMPFGEYSPSVMMKSLGPNMIDVRLTRDSARGLKWSSMTMVMERGGWRLIWFGD